MPLAGTNKIDRQRLRRIADEAASGQQTTGVTHG